MIIATAGHIDHGKTLLVKNLTGKNTDNLPEEKSRGMSIDLGFAYLKASNDCIIGFIDVPGHEKFIQNMLSGVIGVKFCLLIIAADDGLMPQTFEHLEILNLLEISRGAVVITKIDKVKPERIEEIIKLTKNIIKKTTLSNVPIFPVSNITKTGIKELETFLKAQAPPKRQSATRKNFRLAIDRKFNLKGFGLIVTGTIFSGTVKKGDTLILSPKGIKVRVRGIHTQNKMSEIGYAGQRCALNLTNPHNDNNIFERGCWIVSEEANFVSDCFDAHFSVSSYEKKPLKHLTRAFLHFGSSKIICRVVILKNKEINPGDSGFVQLILENVSSPFYGDRFIIRDESGTRTIGAGEVIDPYSIKKNRNKPERTEKLLKLKQLNNEKTLLFLLTEDLFGIDLIKFYMSKNLIKSEAEKLCRTLPIKIFTNKNQQWGILESNFDVCKNIVYKKIRDFFAKNKNISILNEDKIINEYSSKAPEYVIKKIIDELFDENKLYHQGKNLSLTQEINNFDKSETIIWEKIKSIFDKNKFHPPSINSVCEELGLKLSELEPTLKKALKLGYIIRISKNRYYYPTTIFGFAIIAEKVASTNQKLRLDLKIYKENLGISRNLVIELLEFFDRKGFTKRLNNERFVKQNASEFFYSL